MAEERLVDDDKDRKYKIRKNENGEDELYIDDTADDEAETVMEFEVPELDSDDEEAAVMTPEQLAERDRLRAEAEAKKNAKIAEISEKIEALNAKGDFESSLYYISEADDLNAKDGRLEILRLQALTADYTDFSLTEQCSEAVGKIKEYASAELKEKYGAAVIPLKDKIAGLKEEVESLNEENERQKELRREKFLSKRKTALILFAVTVLPMLVFAVLAVYYGVNMSARLDGLNITLFIAFVSIAGVFFVASLLTARNLWGSVNNVKRNERNSSSKLGREYEEKKAEAELIEKIISSFGE